MAIVMFARPITILEIDGVEMCTTLTFNFRIGQYQI